jgi:hypothetical protein
MARALPHPSVRSLQSLQRTRRWSLAAVGIWDELVESSCYLAAAKSGQKVFQPLMVDGVTILGNAPFPCAAAFGLESVAAQNG